MTNIKWKKRFYSILLSGVLTASTLGIVPPLTTHAEKGEGVVKAVRSFDSSYDAENAYSGNDLGCTYTPEQTTFKVWSPLATSVVLCRYAAGNGGSAIEELPLEQGAKGVWSVTVPGDIVNTYYTYKVTANGKTNEAVDIYAKAAGVNGDRAMVVDLDSTDPVNWDKNYKRKKTQLSDIIVWEVHIRDFSIDPSSGVSEANRGKYKAFTESTTVNGEGRIPSCVNYLKELGVTHVQILPMYDYASVDETQVTNTLGKNYNWGYDPENYNVPEGSYSSNPYDGNVRITEMKEMIQALHDAGIKVIMDVVYNHTYDTADSNFTKIMPDYYYKINTDLTYNNQSGCGNATRSESAMYRKFMVDSLNYWAGEYNLDGFRFDLMGIHDVDTMAEIRRTLDANYGEGTIVLYGEGWTGDGNYDENSAHKANEARLDPGVGYFNDQIRDAIKGEHKFDKTIGLVQNGYVQGSFLEPGEKWPNNIFGGIMGSVGKTDGKWGMWRPFWSKSSNCSLSYTSAHDNLTLWDKLTEGFGKLYDSTDDKLIRMNKMAGSVILTSKGGTFMQAGEEFARTKQGDDNSYASSDAINRIDWTRVGTYSAIQKYYEGMISIRKAFSGFRSITTRSGDNWNPNGNNLTWISKDENGLIGFYETNDVAGEWNRVAVLINNATSDTTATLTGASNWVIVADGTTAGTEKIRESGSSVAVPAKSVVVAVPKDTFDANPISANKAPSLNVKAGYEAFAGDSVSFTVQTSDPDGDTVTLSATGIPTGAAFDAATGSFQWNEATAGTHTITFSATDGKETATQAVTITVTDKTTALQTAVTKAEGKNYKESDLSETVWSAFSQALETAKGYISQNETDDARLAAALKALQSAVETAQAELSARDELTKAKAAADSKLADGKASPANYDAAAITDLETVIGEAAGLLETAHTKDAYDSSAEDLSDAVKACVSVSSVPTIRVKADGWDAPCVYIWKGVKPISKEWPGTALSKKDGGGWYIFELPEGTTDYNVIINDGGNGNQTADITGITGSIDITVTSFSGGKSCQFDTEEHPVGSGSVAVDKTRLAAKLSSAKQITDYEKNEALAAAVTAGETVNKNASATQVEVNQAVRALKKAISQSGVTPPVPSRIDIAEAEINTPKVTYTYNGSEQKPAVTVSYQSVKLTEDTDYTVTYTNNIHAKAADAQNAPLIVIEGIGSYTGTKKLTFAIEQADQPAGAPTTLTAGSTAEKVSDLTLKGNWAWDAADAETALTLGASITAKAVYQGSDAADYKITAVTVTITKADCDHPQDAVEIRDAKPATCSAEGYTGDKYCTACENIIENGSVIPKLAHTWDTGKITKVPTETTNGSIVYTCIVCDEKNEITLDAFGEQQDPGTTESPDPGTTETTPGTTETATPGTTETTTPGTTETATPGTTETATPGTTETATPGTTETAAPGTTETATPGTTETATPGTTTPGTTIPGTTESPTPGTTDPGTTPGTTDPGTTTPGTTTPGTTTPGTTTQGTNTPDTNTPGTNTPGTTTPGTTTPGTTTPGTTTPGTNTTEAATTESNPAMSAEEAAKQTTVTIPSVSKTTKGTLVKDQATGTTYRITSNSASGKTVEYAFNNNSLSVIVIPDTVVLNGASYKVTSIASGALKLKKVTEVTIGANVQTIGKKAFYGCLSLKKVTLGNNVTTIKDQAFQKCTALEQITLPAKLNKIGKQAFYGCRKLSVIKIKTTKLTKKKIGSSAFKNIAAKPVITVPARKVNTYKKMLKSRGLTSKATIKK